MTQEDDPRTARYNQRIVEASTQHMMSTGESSGCDQTNSMIAGHEEKAIDSQDDIDMNAKAASL